MASEKTALIAGATGLVGSYLLRLLLQSNYYGKVIAIGRRPLPFQDPKLEQKTVDFNALENLSELKADHVFCCLGTTMKKAGSKENFYRVDHTYVVNMAKAASRNPGTQFLVISSMGANKNSAFFYNRVKGEMEADLAQFPLAAVHIFRPSLLTGNRQESRFGEKIGETLMRILKPIMVGPLRKFRAIPAAVVAKAMLQKANENARGIYVYQSDEIARSQPGAR